MSRCDARIFAGLFLFIIIIDVPLSSLLGMIGISPLDRTGRYSARPVVTLDGLLGGETGPSIEKWLSDRSVCCHSTGSLYREMVFLAVGQTNPSVLVGKNRWLFIPSRFREFESEQKSELVAEAVRSITDVHNIFESAGIPLLLLIIPDRSRTYSDFVYKHGRIPPNRASFLADVMDNLRMRGVRSYSLEDDFQRGRKQGVQVFFRDDHHWTFQGANIGVQAAARYIRPYLPGRANGMDSPVRSVEWTRTRSKGSLSLRLGFRKDGFVERPFLDYQPAARFFPAKKNKFMGPVVPNSAFLISASNGLFGAPEFLANELGRDVGYIVAAGNGPFYGLSLFIRRILNDRRSPKPAVVLWLFPEYHTYSFVDEPSRLPEHSLAEYRTVDFTVEGGIGTISSDRNTFLMTLKKGSFSTHLKEPVRHVRLMMESRNMVKRGYISCKQSKDAPLIIINDQGFVSYDFTADRASRTFDFVLKYFRMGATVGIGEICTSDPTNR